MNRHRLSAAVVVICALVASFMLRPAAVYAAALPGPATVTGPSCEFAHANLHFDYFEADRARSLVWWGATESATSHDPVVLKNRATSSPLDCFKAIGGFGGSRFEFQLYLADLCLNVAGNSHAVGAHVILYACGNPAPANELFVTFDAGTGDQGRTIQSTSSGLCVDLSNGYHVGSILVQKTCNHGDIYQSWFVA